MSVNVFKCRKEAILPTYGSDSSACFDLYSCVNELEKLEVYSSKNNQKLAYKGYSEKYFILPGNSRAVIPTGLIFDLPVGYSMRVHPRSGLSLKNGITLINCEGIIDNDYIKELGVPLYNTTDEEFRIYHGMRIAQGEIFRDSKRVQFSELHSAPEQKTQRSGGFGSTGV